MALTANPQTSAKFYVYTNTNGEIVDSDTATSSVLFTFNNYKYNSNAMSFESNLENLITYLLSPMLGIVPSTTSRKITVNFVTEGS